jgi:GTPase involved in cell partitioning and DNA repair
MGFPKYGGIGGKGGNVVVIAKEGERVLYLKVHFLFEFNSDHLQRCLWHHG